MDNHDIKNKMLKIESLQKKDFEEFSHVLQSVFEQTSASWMLEFIKEGLKHDGFSPDDLKVSLDNKIIGFHIFNEENIKLENIKLEKISDSINIIQDISCYENKKGIQGFAMGILLKHRRKGFGTALVEYEKIHLSKKYDYLWGGNGQGEGLNNIEFWKKSRKIVAVRTLEFLKNDKTYFTMMNL